MFYLKLEKSNFKGNWFMDLMNWFYKLLSINPVLKKSSFNGALDTHLLGLLGLPLVPLGGFLDSLIPFMFYISSVFDLSLETVRFSETSELHEAAWIRYHSFNMLVCDFLFHLLNVYHQPLNSQTWIKYLWA